MVFEDDNGCYAFEVSSGYEYKTFSSAVEVSNYYVKIFALGDNGFSVAQQDLPLKIPVDGDLRLIEQSGSIRGVIFGGDNVQEETALECLFDSADLSFGIPRLSIQSAPVSYDFPGLLLGLSDANGNIRTLYIRNEAGRICVDEYIEQIVFPRMGKLYSLRYFNEQQKFYSTNLLGDIDYLSGSIDIQKLIVLPLGEDNLPEIKMAEDELEWQFLDCMDVPLYVGDEYICYIQEQYFSGGGSFSASSTEIRFDKLDDLSKFSFTGQVIPEFTETTFADLVFGEKAAALYQSNIYTYSGSQSSYIDFRELAIKRNAGRWSLMLPVMDEYYHPGNGSNANWIREFATFSNDVPTEFASNAEAMEYGGWSHWYTKDMLQFIGSDAFLAQYDYQIGISSMQGSNFYQEALDLRIPIDIDEYIVAINFADSVTQELWSDELNQITR
jgi:hypothetical protein